MAYEIECDIFLGYIYDLQYKTLSHSVSRHDLAKIPQIANSNYSLISSVNDVTSILVTEGLISRTPDGYSMTDKGVAFLNTDTFVARRKRWDIDNYHKSFLYKTRHWSYMLSVIAIVLSIYSVVKSPNDTQRILLLPPQQLNTPNSTHDTLPLKDTSLKIGGK